MNFTLGFLAGLLTIVVFEVVISVYEELHDKTSYHDRLECINRVHEENLKEFEKNQVVGNNYLQDSLPSLTVETAVQFQM